MSGRATAILALAAALMPRAAAACAGCRNPSIPVARNASFASNPGEVRATVALTATAIHTVHTAGCADPATCHEVPKQREFLHNQNLYPGELRAMVEVSLSSSLGLESHLPFRLVTSTIRYTIDDGQPYTPLDPDVHHRDETLAGIADPWLLGRIGGALAGWWLSARTGISVPLGKTEPNPFALGDLGLRHQHIQFGNGTFDPVVVLDAGKSFGRLQTSAYAQAVISLYENKHGFRAGNRVVTGIAGGGQLFGNLVALLGLDLMYDGPEHWDGQIRQDGFLGRTELLAGATLTRPLGATTFSASVRAPLHRHIIAGSGKPGQLSSPVILTLAASRAFGAGR